MTRFRFKVKGGWVVGSLRIPTDIGAVNVQAVGGSKAEALMRAATVAQRISEDPVMRALMPPQAQAAIVAAKALSVAAKHGAPQLKKLWKRLKGPGKKRLAAVLAEEADKSDVSGTRYQTSYRGVRMTNRGAWMEWQDPEHDNPEADYEDDYGVSGRRKRKRKKRGERGGAASMMSRRREKREADDADAPLDEPQAPVDEPQQQAPVDEPQQSQQQDPPADNEPPVEGWDY